ncbi:zinc-dependent metalloprotease [Leptobacterium sp. I13]|uniref:zinc-dependent metalloprotease n=1 Tax=Leptobacterium meishanense TaxID=3128904 RepID=UPI0030EEDFC2
MKRLATFTIMVLSLMVNGQFLADKDTEQYEGFFNFYYEESQDKIYLEVTEVDQEFLYVYSLSEGIGSNDIGLDRGQLGNEQIVKFQKAGNKLLLVQPNLKYRAITENELEKQSVAQAFAKSVLYGFNIEEEKNGRYLIDITEFLMQDAHGVANRLQQAGQGSYSMDKNRSALSLDRTRAFPKNVEFEALLTFKGNPKGGYIQSVTPNAKYVSVVEHHSFIELPDNQYKPRRYDPRSGSFMFSYYDYATPVDQPIKKQFITRHRLQKKDPTASISEPVEPIVYYLDNGTPEPIRSALLEGARWWNQAFEAIGYKNAFQVKILPDDADPLDVRYNVIQWVHRSTRGWSYGASITDPRTGEIIKGHVSLGSLRIRQDFLIAQALMNRPFKDDDNNTKAMLEFALARIRQLSAHEIGHTLGFAHNFAASTNGRASVMDYPHPKLSVNEGAIDFSNAYDVNIGEWDKVAVAYAYQSFSPERNEQEALNKILTAARDEGLRYISDSDARPQGGAHAFAHLWDNGNNSIDELKNILKIRKTAINNFSIDNIRSNEPYSVLEDVFVPLYFFHRYQTEAVVKVIGGLDYNYAVKDDGQLTVKQVDRKTQEAALGTLINTLDPEVLAIPEEKLKLFPPRANGYYRSRESFKGNAGVAFDPLAAAETASNMTLSLLLHPERAERMVQQKALDEKQLGLSEMLNELLKNTIKTKSKKGYLKAVQLAINYQVIKNIMQLGANEKSTPQVKAVVHFEMMKLKTWLASQSITPDMLWMGKEVEHFLGNPSGYKTSPSPKIPDGSPIGMDCYN